MGKELDIIKDLVKISRSYRRFIEEPVSKEILIELVDMARLSASAANLQPLKYVIVNDKKLLKPVFYTLKWAGYLPDYQPHEEEMPRAYIIILLDKRIREDPAHDAGIAAMSISLVAYEKDLGSCILGAVSRDKLRKILNIPEEIDIVLVVALGYPAEESVVDKVKDDNIKYWLGKDGVLHVPKREFEEIAMWNSY